jgi:adenylate cyclase
VYALFGAPIADDTSHETALACALDFQRAAQDINRTLAEQGLPSIAYGIGLHTGHVVTAHIGTSRRRQFSAIGDTVNCGARLCSIAQPGEVVVSGDLYERLDKPPAAKALDPIPLKGVSRDLRPFRIDATSAKKNRRPAARRG